MFGYIEPDFSIEAVHNHTDENGFESVYELRREETRGLYISFVLKAPDGATYKDLLFFYEKDSICMRDWGFALSDKPIQIDDLHWEEVVSFHHVGKRRDGSTIMY